MSSAVLLLALKRNIYKEKRGGISLWAFLWASVTEGSIWTPDADLEKSVSSLAARANLVPFQISIAATEIWIEARFALAALLGKDRLCAKLSGCSN